MTDVAIFDVRLDVRLELAGGPVPTAEAVASDLRAFVDGLGFGVRMGGGERAQMEVVEVLTHRASREVAGGRGF